MNKLRASAIALGTAALLAPALSSAGTAKSVHLSATMTPKQVVTPKNKPWRVPANLRQARGTFSGSTSANGRSLRWRISYSNLGHPSLVIADIHLGKPGRFGPILVRLCGPCKSGQSGIKKLKPGKAAEFTPRNTWVTLITNKYPNGVVRGTIRTR
jgi:CHRD domain